MGYSIENVAKDIGISKGNLSEIENGKRVMRFELFKQFGSLKNPVGFGVLDCRAV